MNTGDGGDRGPPLRRNPATTLVAKGEASGESYALMYDRLAISEGRPQRYGSQLRCQGGKLAPYPLEDPGQVEAWRKAMGMPFTYADQLANLDKVKVPCG